MHFDVEANIIAWELSKGPIEYADEIGNFIIHFSANGKPVYIEILNASKFIGKFDKIKNLKNLKTIKKMATVN